MLLNYLTSAGRRSRVQSDAVKDGCLAFAKVGVAGSNPVSRSILLLPIQFRQRFSGHRCARRHRLRVFAGFLRVNRARAGNGGSRRLGPGSSDVVSGAGRGNFSEDADGLTTPVIALAGRLRGPSRDGARGVMGLAGRCAPTVSAGRMRTPCKPGGPSFGRPISPLPDRPRCRCSRGSRPGLTKDRNCGRLSVPPGLSWRRQRPRRRGQVVRRGSAKPLFTGSNPVVASS